MMLKYNSLLFFKGMFGGKKKKKKRADNDEYEEEEEYYEEGEYEEEEYEEGEDDNIHNLGRGEDGEILDLSLDLIDKGSEFEVRAFIASSDIDNIEVCATREQLTVRAEIEEQVKYKESEYLFRELFYGTTERSILIPEEIDVDGVEAKMKNGVLIISLPKLDKNRERTVSVKK